MKRAAAIILTLGVILMAAGIVFAGITYREMRTERILHETVRLCKSDLSRISDWHSEALPIYQSGKYALWLSADDPSGRSPNGNHTEEAHLQRPAVRYFGKAELVVEKPSGEIALRTSVGPSTKGTAATNRTVRFPIDSFDAVFVSSGHWTLSMRIVEEDPQFMGILANVVVIPPHADEFIPYVQRESYKLFGSGLLVVFGFTAAIFGGNMYSGRSRNYDANNPQRLNQRKEIQ